jgi:hypothetical protein
VAGGAEAGHVASGLGDQDLHGGPANAGDGLQQLNLPRKRAHLLLDPRRQLGDRGLELVDALQVQAAQERVVPCGARK